MWGSIFGSGSKAKKSKSGGVEDTKRPVSSQEARRKAKLERQKDLRARRKNSVTEFYVSESSNSDSSSDDDTPAKDPKKDEYSKVGSSQFDDEPVDSSDDDSRVSENPLHSKSKAAAKTVAFDEPEDEPESESEGDDDEPNDEPQQQGDDEPADGDDDDDDDDEPRDSEEPDSEEESSSEDESSMVSDKAKKYEWELEDVDMEAALTSFYTKYNPERVATVSEIVDTYDGEFTLMLRVLCDRYHLSHGQMDMFLDNGRGAKQKKSGGKSPAKSALKKRDSVDNSGDDGRGRRVSISTDHNTVTHIETKDEVKKHLKESARERARARERAVRGGDEEDDHSSESDSESESEDGDDESLGSDEHKTSHAPATAPSSAPAPAFMSEEEVREKERKEKKKARDDKRRDKNYQRMKEKLAQTQKAFMMQQQHQQQLLMLHERQQAHLQQGQSTGIPPSPVSYMSPQQQAQMLALQQQQAMLQAHIYGLGGDPTTMSGIEPVSDLHMSPTQLERAAGGGRAKHGAKPSAVTAAATAADEVKKKDKATIGGGKHLGEAVLRLRQQEDDAARELERMRKAKDDALSQEIKEAELKEIEAQKNAERDRAERERERARAKSAAIIAEQRKKKGMETASPPPTSSTINESAPAPTPAVSTDPSVISQLADLRKELAATKAALAESADDRTQVMALLKQVVSATNSIVSNPPSPVGSASNSRASSPAPSRQRATSGVAATPTVAPLVSEVPPDLDDPSQLAASVAAILTRAASPAPSRSASPTNSVRSRSPGPGTPLLHQQSNNTNMVQSIVAGTGGGTPQPMLYAPKPYRQEQQGGVAAAAPTTSLGNNSMLPPSATPLVKGAVKGASAIAASGPGSSVRSRASEKVRGATPHTTNGAPMTTSKQAGMRKVGPPDDDWYECWNPALGKTYFHSASRNKSAWTAPFPVYEVEPTDDASVDSNYYYSAAGAGAAAAADAKTDYSVNLNGQQQGTPAREGGGDIYDDSSIASGSSRSRSPAAHFVMQPLSVQGSAKRGRIASANARRDTSDGNNSFDSRGIGGRGRSPSPFRDGSSVGSHGGSGASPAPASHKARSSVSPTTRIGAQRRASNLHSPSSRAMAEAQHQLQASEYLHHHPMLKYAHQNPFQAREERRFNESGQQQLAKVAQGGDSFDRQRTKSPAQQHAYQRSRQGLVGGGVAGQLPPPVEIHSSRTSTDGRPAFMGGHLNARAPSPSNRGGGGASGGIDAHSNLPYSRSSSPRVRGSSSPGTGSSGYTNYANSQVKNKRSGNMNVMANATAAPHMNMSHAGDPNRPQYRPPSTAAPGFGDSGPQFLPPDDYDDIPNSIGMFSSSSNGSGSRGGGSSSPRKNAGSPGPKSPNRFAQAHADAEAAKSHWREALSKTGKRYYYNVVTRESTYRRPPLYMPLQ
jgi:hypothetical protein